MPLRRGSLLFVLFALVATQSLSVFARDPRADSQPGLDALTAARLRAHVEFLASEAMQGREAATASLDIAGDYAASMFTLAGVEPAGEWVTGESGRSRSYFQTFDVSEITPKSQSLTLETRQGDTVMRHAFEQNVDFTSNGSSTLQISAPLVFVGYGYKVKDANWDDYAGLDLKGKIAVALDGAPGRDNEASWFWKQENRRRYFGRFASIYKAMGAAEAGAVALVILPSPNSDQAPLTRDLADNRPPRESQYAKGIRNLPPRRDMVLANEEAGAAIHGGFASVSTVKVTERVAGLILEGSNETSTSLQKKIDSAMKPMGFPLPTQHLTIDIQVDSKILTTRNVLAMIPGSDPALAGDVVMIGAHYDHDGARGGYVWPGADDNASGTAAVIELARAFAANPVKPKRTLLFALWSAEEKGLLGSKFYVDHPTFPVDKTITYINLDMIGRDGDPTAGGDPHAAVGGPVAKVDPSAAKIDPKNWMSVEGSIGYPSLKALTESMSTHVDFVVTYKETDIRFAASDHLYFARKGVPVISYFDGGHDDYHQPTDTADKINYPKMEKVARLCFLTMWNLANAGSRPEKVEQKKGDGK